MGYSLRNTWWKRALPVLFFFVGVLPVRAQLTNSSPSMGQLFFQTKEGAIRGYDPVAYFKENSAQKGDTAYPYSWGGTTWLFANDINRQAFVSTPEKYVPQYGGYCAYGTSENHLSPTDPNAFTFVNDKLYLNYNSKVKEAWLKDKTMRIEKADSYWPALQNK